MLWYCSMYQQPWNQLLGSPSQYLGTLFGDDNDVDVDADVTDETVDVVITKNTTLNGHKVKKDAVVSVTPENADKLISDGKAKLKE